MNKQHGFTAVELVVCGEACAKALDTRRKRKPMDQR